MLLLDVEADELQQMFGLHDITIKRIIGCRELHHAIERIVKLLRIGEELEESG